MGYLINEMIASLKKGLSCCQHLDTNSGHIDIRTHQAILSGLFVYRPF